MSRQERVDFGAEGVSDPGLIHIHLHAMGCLGDGGGGVVELAVRAALPSELMLLIGVDQVHLGIVLGNGSYGDHITAVCLDIGAFQEPLLGLQIDGSAPGNFRCFVVVVLQKLIQGAALFCTQVAAYLGEDLLQQFWITFGVLVGAIHGFAQLRSGLSAGVGEDQRGDGFNRFRLPFEQLLGALPAGFARVWMAELTGQPS